VTPSDPEALEVAFRVLEVLQRFGIAYHLGGSYASAIHGVPRQTHDVDLVVDLGPEHVPELTRAFRDEFYVDEKAVARAVSERTSVNLVHLDTGVKVDLFVKGSTPFDAMEFSRRIVVRLGDEHPRDVFVKSAEDTVLRKLLWFRLGGDVSDRQLQDARGIVRVQGSRLDVDYLTRSADELGLRDLLDRVLIL
jgi:D-ribose pyranose/furanose isomerase RbsD